MSGYRFEKFAGQFLTIVSRSGPEFMTNCPFHGGSDSMRLNVDKGLFICFACGRRGGIKTLLREFGLNPDESPEDDVGGLRKQLVEMDKKHQAGIRVLPESYLKRFAFPSTYWTKDRGLTKEIATMFDLGFSPMGDDFGGVFATIPLRNSAGELLGVIKRYLEDDAPLRYLYPKGFKKSEHLFGSWLLEDSDTNFVVLTEGSIDAMKVWQAGFPAMAIYGNDLSAKQAKFISRLGVTTVIGFFDNDDGGKTATSSMLGFRKHTHGEKVRWEYDVRTDLREFTFVKKAVYPRRSKSDPGAMTIKHIEQAIHGAEDAYVRR